LKWVATNRRVILRETRGAGGAAGVSTGGHASIAGAPPATKQQPRPNGGTHRQTARGALGAPSKTGAGGGQIGRRMAPETDAKRLPGARANQIRCDGQGWQQFQLSC
jgi:hypothetical protein